MTTRPGRRFLSVDDLNNDEIARIFQHTHILKNKAKPLAEHRNAVLMTAFFEPSTRTRLSFEMAAHRLGMGVSVFDQWSSSMKKGEGEAATINNLLALRPDFLVIRQRQALDFSFVEDDGETVIINGGDGINEHPTQALLDCFTLLEHIEEDSLVNKHVLIIGDIVRSRVAHSNIKLMRRLGAKITLLAPREFHGEHQIGLRHITSFGDVDSEVDAVMCLRIQKERLKNESFLDDQTFAREFGLTHDRFLRLGQKCVVLHPGPMSVDVEIATEVALHTRSLINKQVSNGVMVRASLLKHLHRGEM